MQEALHNWGHNKLIGNMNYLYGEEQHFYGVIVKTVGAHCSPMHNYSSFILHLDII